jgi:hypothetical protein
VTGAKTRWAEWPSSLGDGVSENPLFVRPIVRDGDRYAVAAPRALLMALCNALIRLAKDAGVTGQLAANYAEPGFLNIEGSKSPARPRIRVLSLGSQPVVVKLSSRT